MWWRFDTILIQEPMAIFSYLAALVGLVFILGESKNPFLQKFFHYAPPLIWTYFLPISHLYMTLHRLTYYQWDYYCCFFQRTFPQH